MAPEGDVDQSRNPSARITTHADAHQSAAVSFIAILITLPFVIRFATFRIADLMFVKAAATIVAEKITIHSGIGLSTATTPGYKRVRDFEQGAG
jgi:hypothetical protein